MQSLKFVSEVNDCEWNPFCSTVFGSVATDGRLELWYNLKYKLQDLKHKINKNIKIFNEYIIF